MDLRGGDLAVWRGLVEAAREAGFPSARAGIAGTCITAAVAARNGIGRVVPPGRDRSFLAGQPLDALPAPEDLRLALRALGLRTCQELADLPADEVELRFGSEGLGVWRLARADDPRWPFRPAPADAATAEAELEPPVELSEPLRFLLPGLLESVLGALALRQRIPRALRLVLLLDGEPREEVRPVRPARPTGDLRVLADLCRRALEPPLPAPVSGIRLEVLEEAAPAADQLDAFQRPAPDPSSLHSAMVPVFARWGEGALSRARSEGAHLPGRAALWEPRGVAGIEDFTRAGRGGTGASAAGAWANQLHLTLRRPPSPLPARVGVGEGSRPIWLDVEGTSPGLSLPARLTAAEGPERLSGEWWDAEGYAREYWRVETAQGALLLLYREARSGAWYLEGWYD